MATSSDPVSLAASELPIKKILSDDYAFSIPVYQRPYSWTTEQVDELLDDLTTAANAPGVPYFLGSIVLVKTRKDKPPSDVVDGQQRLTTLTLLLCALRDLDEDADRAGTVHDRHIWHDDSLDDQPAQPRLTLGRKDKDFFSRKVQNRDSVKGFTEAPAERDWPDSHLRLHENAARLFGALKDRSPAEQESLLKFVLNCCYLVVVTTTNTESAYRIFSVLNDRGLPLSATDILKAKIIGDLRDPDAQDRYSREWEEIEDDLGRDRFRDLFAHIRMIYAKEKLRRTLHADFKDTVLRSQANSVTGNRHRNRAGAFIDDTLHPYWQHYRRVLDARVVSERNAAEINHYISHLQRLDNFDWIPPALAYLQHRSGDSDALPQFFGDLERLAFFLFVTRAYVNPRINRYAKVLREIEDDRKDLSRTESALQLTLKEQAAFRERLGQDVYARGSRVMRPLLLKLDSTFLERDGGAVYNQKVITVEHVLPQTPPEGSVWRQWFTDEEREEWTHKLANLVLLSRRRNTAASNRELKEKVRTYLLRDGSTPFILTQGICDEEAWTPEVLQRRQKQLIDRLSHAWCLHGTE